MSSWRECKLGEFIEVINGYAFKSQNFLEEQIENSLPVVKIKNVANGDVNLKAVQFHLFDKSLEKYLIQKNDILIALTGNHPQAITQVVGEASKYKLDELAFLNQRVAKVKARKNMSNDFLYYFLKDDASHDYLASQSSGSASQANISKNNIENMTILLPPLEEQKTIAEILSSLDDKIDLLRRQNQTLEDLARTLFRQWFIEEAKEGWEEVTLSDVMELKYGKDHKHLSDGEIPIYGSGGIMRYGDTAIYNQESILIPRKGTLNNIFYVDEPFWTVDTIFWSKINSEKISGKLLFEFLKTLNFSNMNVGSAVPSLTTKVLNEISFALPSLKEQEEFKIYTDNAWDKIKQNKKQIQTLENLRDTLLPKLLSREVKVEYE